MLLQVLQNLVIMFSRLVYDQNYWNRYNYIYRGIYYEDHMVHNITDGGY